MAGRYQTTSKTCGACQGLGYYGGYQTKLALVGRYVDGRYKTVTETRTQYNPGKNQCLVCTKGKIITTLWVPDPVPIAPQKPEPIPPPKQTIPIKPEYSQQKAQHPEPSRPNPMTTDTWVYIGTGTQNMCAAQSAIRQSVSENRQPLQENRQSLSENRQSVSDNRNSRTEAEAPLLSGERIDNQMQQAPTSQQKCQLKWSRKKTVTLIVFIVVVGFAIAFLMPILK